MNQVTGMTVNIISVLWLVFAIIFFSFPFEMPATCMSNIRYKANTMLTQYSASNMNYTCVVIGGFLLIELAWWIIAGKKYSQTVQRAREEEQSVSSVIVNEAQPKA